MAEYLLAHQTWVLIRFYVVASNYLLKFYKLEEEIFNEGDQIAMDAINYIVETNFFNLEHFEY